MPQRSAWPVAFFDEDYLVIYRPWLSEERTAEEASFIERSLGLSPGARLLDLACGIGRHALALAARGYRVTGLDFNARYLRRAQQQGRERGAHLVSWVRGDMRALPFAGCFDGLYSYFTSFGYFGDDENFAILQDAARVLKPGGAFLMDLFNRDYLLLHPQERNWNQREDGSLLMEEFFHDPRTSTVTARQTLIGEGGAQVHKEYRVRMYTCAEMIWLLARAGLEVTQVWGGPDGSDYGLQSRRLVLKAVRAGERDGS